ncbi:WD repeat-containing protein on Y chromosome-like [Micropterus salmoides]|uniref:WD repeat-containing protein on Y chromosome-like n=1 Tax=Micropterus salmoides TaxID=27706 RepID=UPI0018ED3305|nr:WD repeat-containing protein on Y chromosome-like [Micropterus salmoides]
MERHTEIAEYTPEKTAMDSSEFTKTDKMFSHKDIPQIVQLFREADADGGGGLDMEEFCGAMRKLYGDVDKEELIALHMQVDANCDTTVDLGELMDFLLNKNKASESMDYKNQAFPKPITKIPVDHCKAIIRLLFIPYEDGRETDQDYEELTGQTRSYQRGKYLSISSDGILKAWTDSFDMQYTTALYKTKKTLPFSHINKMCVHDMVYLRELKQLAVSTSDRELLFYDCNDFPEMFKISHSLIVEDNIVNAMNYWSKDTKAVFSFGDVKGFLSVFISYNVKKNGLFCPELYDKISLRSYKTVCVSALLKKTSKDFLCVKVPVFNDTCMTIQYFTSLNSFAICGNSSKTMVLAGLPKPSRTKVSKKVFRSRGDNEFFTCVEYSPSAERLVTGGTDGLLRVWFPHKTMSCEQELTGHVKPITCISFNPIDKIFVSLSEDKNVRVWSEDGWMCRQSFQAQDMGRAPISSVCYNIHNNELVLANSDIGKYLGRGTDVFKETLTSHDKPLCGALYHSIFKQVVSVCRNGVVTVWDIVTGKAVMQFKVTPGQNEGLTAMSFDEAQRRLITVSQDGKLRLWNFNNGTELGVLPVTVPREVTGIACINNRVFVSGRNSKRIFDLDLEEQDNRFLEHDYLNDISSMDVHENTLVTASSNGNIVIWDAETAEALCWLNPSEGPRVHMAGRKDQGRTGSLPVEKSIHKKSTTLTGNKTTSPLILCLKTREVNIDTATLLISADGYINAWSVNVKGGLLGKFRAVNYEGAVITAMSTDVNEQILLTGDSTGKIYLWDIQEFGLKKQADKGPFEDIHGWRVSLCPPPLLGSWRTHFTGVVSVKCDPACENIITAGLDCNVRLWTNTGCCVGLFGRDQWGATQLSPEKNAEQQEPEKPSTAKTRNSHIPFPESPRSSSPTSPLPNFDDLYEQIREVTKTPEVTPTLTFDQLLTEYKQLIKYKPSFDQIKDMWMLGNENTPSPCPSKTTPARGSDHTSDHVHFPTIPDRIQLTKCQTQLKTHPTQTQLFRGGTYPKQSTPQTGSPNLNHTRSKYGRVLKTQQRDSLKGSVLTPCPPNSLPGEQGSDHTSEQVHLLPIPDRVQLTHNQTQLKPNPPRTKLISGGTNLKQSSPQTASPNLNQTRSKYGRVLKSQKRERSESDVLTPCPPNTLQGKQGSDHRSEQVHLPPIPDRVQLTHR